MLGNLRQVVLNSPCSSPWQYNSFLPCTSVKQHCPCLAMCLSQIVLSVLVALAGFLQYSVLRSLPWQCNPSRVLCSSPVQLYCSGVVLCSSPSSTIHRVVVPYRGLEEGSAGEGTDSAGLRQRSLRRVPPLHSGARRGRVPPLLPSQALGT